ncbi:META domain-containing protein, partial [Acinetobacter indicus]
SLFLASKPDQPITLKFAEKMLYIGNLFCNINSIGIHFKGNHLYAEQPIVATMMGCPDDINLRESTMIDILVNAPTLYLQSRKGQAQLLIETQKKEKLIFKGVQVNK